MKILVKQFYSLFLLYFLPVRPKLLAQHPFLEPPSACPTVKVKEQVSHPYKTRAKIIVLYILIFIFFDVEWERRMLAGSSFLNAVLICQCLSETHESCHIFEIYISCLSAFSSLSCQDIFLRILYVRCN